MHDLEGVASTVLAAGTNASDGLARIQSAAQMLGSALSEVPETTKRLTDHVQRVEEMVEELGRTNARLADGLEPAAAALHGASARFSDTAERLEAIGPQVDRVTSELRQTATGLDSIMATGAETQERFIAGNSRGA